VHPPELSARFLTATRRRGRDLGECQQLSREVAGYVVGESSGRRVGVRGIQSASTRGPGDPGAVSWSPAISHPRTSPSPRASPSIELMVGPELLALVQSVQRQSVQHCQDRRRVHGETRGTAIQSGPPRVLQVSSMPRNGKRPPTSPSFLTWSSRPSPVSPTEDRSMACLER